MCRILFIILAFTQIININAVSYSGIVLDSKKESIPFASVSVLSVDSTIIFSTLTNEKGEFCIDSIPTNATLFRISMMGYETLTCPISNISNTNRSEFILREKSVTLKEITITAHKNPLKVKDVFFSLDVQNSQLSKQPGIIEVLGFLPGILNLGDGISVIGGGKTLYILNGIEIKSFERIKALHPSQIKDVSLTTHPSAKYGSEYSSVIFINTISRFTDYASAQAEHTSLLGRRYSNNECVYLNISKQKWDNYLSYKFINEKNNNSATNIYDVFNNQNISIRNNMSINRENRQGYTHNLMEGLTFRPSKKLLFNLQYNLFFDSNKFSTVAEESTVPEDMSLLTQQSIDRHSIQHNMDLVGEYIFPNNNKLSLSAGYLYNSSSSDNDLFRNSTDYEYIDGKEHYNSFSFKADYSMNLPKGYVLGAGTSFSYIKNIGHSLYKNVLSDDKYFDDNSNLKDNNTAIYLNLRKQFGKLYTSIGIRGELFSSDYEINESKLYKDERFVFFPNLTMQYPVNNNVTLIGSFTSKSNRPSFRALSPIYKYINSYLLEQGNPLLRQASIYTTSFAMILKNKFVAQARYIRNNNAVIWSLKTLENNSKILVNSPSNIDHNLWLLNLSYSDAGGIYRFNYETSVKYIPTKISYLKGNAPVTPQVSLYLVNQFVITPKTLLSLNINLSSKSSYLGVEQNATYDLSFWIKQSFLKDNRLQLILKGNDLLHMVTPKSYIKINNVCSSSIPDFDTRNVSLTIRYVFNEFKDIFNRKNTNIDNESRIR